MAALQTDFDYKKYLYLAYNRRFLIIFVTLIISFAGIFYSQALTDKYEARSTVFIEENVMASLMQGIAVTTSMDAKIRVLTTAMQTRTLLLQVIRELNLDLHITSDAQREELVQQLRSATNISLRPRDGLFVISFRHENPQVARDYVNTLVRRYIEQNITTSRQDTYDAFLFLAEQIEIFKERLDEADAAVLALRTEKGNLLNRDPGLVLQEIAQAEDRLQELSVRRFELLSQASQAQAMSFDEQGNPMQGHLARLDALEQRLDGLLLRYGPSHPDVVRTRSAIQALEQQRKDNPEEPAAPRPKSRGTDVFSIQAQELRAQEERLRRQIASNREMLQLIPAAQAEFAELEHKRAEQQRVLEQLMNRFGQAEVSRQMELQDKTTTFRVVDPAILPSKPVSPNRLMLMLMGIVLGLGAGLGLTIALDFLDHSVRHVDTLKNLGLPILAVVPRMLDPGLVMRQKRKNLLFYFLAGLMLLMIMGILALEFLQINILHKAVTNLLDQPYVDRGLSVLKRIYWRIFS
ncbi:XrtA system polysaccharide chain length determinant [Desulfonatronum thiodismutans]|uniref:XrtA system polysaccharide chain length determinant n=1 Tax=Desulfonatronum thiodismutans TaxID=159290 RepID=UPI000553F634|nr:XrtA system polysaccharide chain length determinant [Desulfonatronum thiodismutans]